MLVIVLLTGFRLSHHIVEKIVTLSFRGAKAEKFQYISSKFLAHYTLTQPCRYTRYLSAFNLHYTPLSQPAEDKETKIKQIR